MAQNEGFMIAAAIIIAVVILGQNASTPPAGVGTGDNTNAGGVDLCKLVDGQASFTGQNKYLSGTALTADYVRVIEINGDNKKRDLGLISMNSGTVGLTPESKYKLYYGENTTSSTRYTYLEDYAAPCKDATDNKVGYLCTVDVDPAITVYNSDGQVQTNGTNVQVIGTDEVVDVEIKVKSAADSCYGNPQAPSKNAICFGFNSSTYKSVVGSTPSSAIPYSIGTEQTTGFATSCYQLDLLADTASQIVSAKITPNSLKNPAASSADNISIKIEDVDFDLNQDNLDEIWGFEDESNNNLGGTTIVGKNTKIQVS